MDKKAYYQILSDAIEDVFAQAEKEHGCPAGDISVWQELKLEELTEGIVDIIAQVVEQNTLKDCFEYHYTEEEAGMDTIVRVFINDNNLASVLSVSYVEDEGYYYGVFDNSSDVDTISNRDSMMEFMVDNECNGYSCGTFPTIEELNEELRREGLTEWGMFKAW